MAVHGDGRARIPVEAVLRALALLALALLLAPLALLALLALALSATLPVRRTLQTLLALLSITLLDPTSWDVQHCRSTCSERALALLALALQPRRQRRR